MKILGVTIERKKPNVKAFVEPPKESGKSFKYVPIPSSITNNTAKEYKEAVKQATSENWQDRTELYNNYLDAISFDPHLKGLIDRRLLATVGLKLRYVGSDGEEIESVNELIESPVFEDLRREVLLKRIFWGMGLIEMQVEETEKGKWVKFYSYPNKHIDPYQQMVRVRENTPSKEDKSYVGYKNVLFIGKPDDLGLMQTLALYSNIWKRFLMNHWAKYVELAGNNFVHLTTSGNQDPKKIEDMQRWLEDATGAAYDPDKVGIKFESRSSASQNETFANYFEVVNDEMTKLVLGQTMTTEDGSSRSQAEVHERVQETILDADAKSERDFFNYEFYEVHSLYGIPTGGKWVHKENATNKLAAQIDLDIKLKDLGVIFSSEYLETTYGKR